jgi:hypothetical protein
MTSLRQVLKQEEVGKVAVSHFPMAGLARGACLDRRRRKGVNVSSKRYDPRWADWLWLVGKTLHAPFIAATPGLILVAAASGDAGRMTADSRHKDWWS